MNDSVQVVGASDTSDGTSRAFSWTATQGMIDLGTLGGNYSAATAVNATGQVIGWSSMSDGTHRAFSWTATHGMIDLGTLGGSSSGATAVNDSGQVVGASNTSDGTSRAFSWTATQGMLDLGTLGGSYSAATAVNATGQVVGSSYMADGTSQHAFLWTATQGMIDLGTLGGNYSAAMAMNADGQAVGYSVTAHGSVHAFSWTRTRGMIDLGALGGESSWARAVNHSGQVIGSSETGDDDIWQLPFRHAFSWTPGGAMIDLGTFGGTRSDAVAINGGGQVIGVSFTETDGSLSLSLNTAFSWTATGGMLRLGGEASFARAVNESGQVVGSARVGGDVHAVMWPVIAQTQAPIADAYVRGGAYASANFGNEATLRAKKGISADTTRRGYLKFDVSHISDSQRVTLRLYGHASSATGRVKTTVYAVSNTAWDERTVTWNTRPDLGAVLGTVTVDGTATQWVDIDVTAYIRSERRARRDIISLALRTLDHTSAYAEFQSREAGRSGPRLVVTH